MSDALLATFAACIGLWGAGYAAGMVMGFVRKVRDAAL